LDLGSPRKLLGVLIYLQNSAILMSMKKKKKDSRIGRGTPGHYVLNQKSQKFGDRRTKRLRTRAAQKREALASF
jgi:hypothetical protein